MRSTRAEDVSIHAVSPLSIFDAGAGAGAPVAGAEAPADGVAGCWATATATHMVAPSTSIIASARLNRFTKISFRACHSPRRCFASSLEGALVALARPDPDRRLHRGDEDLAVADVAGLRGRRHHVGHLLDEVVRHDDLDLDLREEVHRVLAAAIQLGVSFLAAEAAHLGHGHADHADAGERLLDVVQLERLDDRLDLLHHGPPEGVPRSNGHAAPVCANPRDLARLRDGRASGAAQSSGTAEMFAQASGGGTGSEATGGAAGCCACASWNRAWDGASPGARPRPACSSAW